jgi:O-antigen/teichoic acid export membrane protein
MALVGACSSLLNGLDSVRFQSFIFILGAVINFMLSIYLTQKIGISGPIWGSAISLFLVSPILVFYCFKKIKDLEEL